MSRAAIVCGSAPCVHEDFARAIALYPDAFVALVNGACVAMERCDAVIAGHTNKSAAFAKARAAAFPGKPFEVYANWGRDQTMRWAKSEYPAVTKWFGAEMSTGATSAAKAARMMIHEGYDPVILCGCPLDDSGYFEGESQKGASIGHDCRRVGDPEQNGHRTIVGYREKFKRLADGPFKGKVFSMSGRTREWLGEPW